jgi:hypothetical protein
MAGWIQDVFGDDERPPVYSAVTPTSYYEQLKVNNPALYEQQKQNDPAYIAAQQAAAQAQKDAEVQAQIASAQSANVLPTVPPPTPEAPAGPSALEKLSAVLPSGFEQSLLPASLGTPLVEGAVTTGRGRAIDFINNMLRRGTVTGTGAESARAALGSQDPSVRGRLTDVSNALLENERAKLRGIASEGYTAAGSQPGDVFDPGPYQGRVSTEASQFQQGFPAAFATSAGDLGSLYDVSGLAGAGGAVTSPQNVQYDPYAVAGGKLTSGLEEPAPATAKKRTTAVF